MVTVELVKARIATMAPPAGLAVGVGVDGLIDRPPAGAAGRGRLICRRHRHLVGRVRIAGRADRRGLTVVASIASPLRYRD